MTSNTEAGASAARTEPAAAPSRSGAGVNAPAARRSDASLPLRVLSAVLFLPLLFLAAKVGGLVWLAFSLTVVGLGLREFYQMMESKGLAPHWKSGTFAVL